MHILRCAQGIAEIENNTAKDMMRLAGVIQVPFRAGNQFLGEGGLQVRFEIIIFFIFITHFTGRVLQHPRQITHYR